MQLSRQFELVFMLLQRGAISAGEAARELGVSVRTIYRDVDDLSAAGIPIYTLKGRGGGIRFLPEFTMERAFFTQEERRSLLAAVQAQGLVAEGEGQGVLTKLAGLFREEARPWIAVDFAQWGKRNEEKFRCIKEAVLTGTVLQFLYYNSANQSNLRTVEPLQLWFKHQSWYLWAFCRMRHDIRLFKLNRMRELTLTGEQAKERQLSDWPKTQAEPFGLGMTQTMILRFTKEMAYRVYDEYEEEEITCLPDGSYQVETSCIFDQWVVGHLLSFGSGLKVLAPAWLQQIIAEEGKKLWMAYHI